MNVLMIGTGEYTTGYVHGQASTSDKKKGVVALTLFDLRARGKVQRILMAGTNGTKLPGIRQHLRAAMGDQYRGLDVQVDTFPSDNVEYDPQAYRQALAQLRPGDVVTVFTPDDTHFDIALQAVAHQCHVLVAKPLVKTCGQHVRLRDAARQAGVLVAMEVHKRWDPIYVDARHRLSQLGEFSYFHSYMSQPKSQLDTFRSWAGRGSDISYYLNSHHVDFLVWSLGRRARPVRVYASAAEGWARSRGIPTEDTISITVQWVNLPSGHAGTAIHTATWIAPPSDAHSQQRFFYMGHGGELQVDQAHRGYAGATDADRYSSYNPLFMKYTCDSQGYFAGQDGYGYRSLEDFIDAARAVQEGHGRAARWEEKLATVDSTLLVTAILEAGRRSLDEQRAVDMGYDAEGEFLALE